MMLEHLGEQGAHDDIMAAIERALVDRRCVTVDLGGEAGTVEAGRAIADMV
jgi:tartrate dehydrogenase/decarboxylase/D-malate dehydrogenase